MISTLIICALMTAAKLTPEKTFALLVWDVGRLLRKAVDERAGDVGLTSAQWHVLSTLARCEKLNQAAPNQASLADLLEIEPITLSRQIDRLTAAGMIERLADPADRRAHLLRVTEKAWPLLLKFKEIAAVFLREAMAGVTAAETERMIASLDRIRANLTGKADAGETGLSTPKSRSREGISA
jgi:MarR family transcriptional regulator for hemolysin